MKNIAVITTGLSKVFSDKKGGGEVLLKNLIDKLSTMPDVNLFVFIPDKNELTDKIKNSYPDITFLIYNSLPSSSEYINELKEVFKVNKFDKIINYNMILPFKTTLLQSHSFFHKLNKVSFLLRPIKKMLLSDKLCNQKRAFERAMSDSDYIAVSQFIKNDYVKNFNIPSDKIKVIYPGVNISDIKEIEQNEQPVFGIVANSSINKGGHYLLFALGVLNILKRNFKLLIIAPKFKKDILMQFIITIFGMRKKITALPFQNDMAQFYNDIDVLVLPSLNEAFGLVTLEAMERAKPCIVSSTAGSSEIIKNSNGFTFNRSSFLDFIKKLDKMIKIYNSDFNRYKTMSNAARETAVNYSWQKFALEIIK